MKKDSNLFKTVADIRTNAKLLENVQEFVHVIEYLQEEFDEDVLWYRGVSHAKYELIPKVYRDRLWDIHEDFEWWLFVDFQTRARAFIPEHQNYSEWDWYFTMQHYRLPTRLLDWTRGALIGLYFAVRNHRQTYIPSVYVLSPYWFDEAAYRKNKDEGMIYTTDVESISEEHASRLSSYLGTRREAPPFPLCLEPPAIDRRIAAQQSVFTIHGKYINPFRIVAKRNAPAKIAKIRFSTENSGYIKDQLDSMGISEATLFPDLEGLSRDLKWKRGI